MAIKVTVGQQTFVKKIVVGTPISTAQTGLSIDNFSDFKVATKSEGQVLVYDSAEQAFKNYDLLVGNALAKEFTPGTDKLLLQIDSDKTPVVTGLTTKGHIVPTLDSTFDLGDSAKKFRDLYLSGGTIHLGNIDLKDSSGGFAATDSAGDPVNFNLQGSIQQIRNMFASGGDLSYNASTGIFEFDVEQVYTKANFDSDFNVTLDSAVLEGVGLTYDNATNTLSIDSAELSANFRQDIRGYISGTDAGGDGSFSYNATTGVITYTGPSSAEVRAHFIGIDSGGDGAFSYESATGKFIYRGPNSAEVRAHFSGGDGIGLSSGVIRIDSSELTNLYRQTIRGYVSGTDAGGDGSFAYDAATGVFTYTGPSASEVRAHFTAGEGIDISSGEISGEDATTSNKGIASFNTDHFSVSSGAVSIKTDGIDDTHIDFGTGTNQVSTADIPEQTNLYYTTARADSDAKASLLAIDAGGDGSFTYDSATGVMTYTGPSASEVRAHFTGGTGITISSGDVKIDSSELTSLYRQTIRGYTSATDAGGDGSFSYNATTGVFTYTGPSATEVKAHFQPLDSSANPTFNQVRGPAEFVIDPAAIGDATGTVKIMGNLQVEGTQTTINSSTIVLKDKNIVIADSAADSSALNGAGITWGDSAIVSNPTFTYNHADARLVSNREINAPLFSGSGASLTNLPAASLTGTIDSARIPALLIADIGNIAAIDHDALTNFVANEHIDHTAVSITAGVGLKGGGTIASTRDLAIDSAELLTYYEPIIRHDNLSGFVANEHIDHTSVSIATGDGLSGGGTIASTRTLKIDSSDLANLYSKVIVHDNTNGFVADEHVAHTGVSIVAGNGLAGGGDISSSRTISIDSANVRGMFSAGGDLSYNSGTGQFSFDVEAVYTKENFDSDYVLAKDSANTAVERNQHIDSADFAVTVASKTANHVYSGGSGNAYYIDGTESPILNLKIGRTYQFNLSSSDMSSHPFRFYYDAAKTTQYTTNVTTGATFARIYVTEATPPVLHYQCSSHGYMGHALQIGTRNFTGFTTTNLTEGTNLYYTDGRFDTRLAAKTTDNLTEGSSNLYFTNARAQAVSLDSAEAIALIDSAYVQARQLPSTDSAATQAMIDSNFINMAIDIHIPDGGSNFDSAKISFGNDSDLKIFHNGSHSVIQDAGTGSLQLQSNSFAVQNATGTESQITALSGGGVSLFFNNLKRVETGIDNVQILNENGGASKLKVSSNNNTLGTNAAAVELYANFYRKAGVSIFGDSIGATSPVEEWFIGRPYAQSSQPLHITSNTSGQKAAVFNQLGSVELYYNNSKKIETTDSGVTITGEIIADSAVIGGLRFPKADGLNNQVIRTDGAGNLSFVSVAAISGAIDSAAVIVLIDSAYVQARTAAGTDSAATQAMIDSNFANGDSATFNQISIPDGGSTTNRLNIGNNDDFKIYHDGSQTVISNVNGSGPIKIQGKFGEQSIIANQDGAVELYYDNSKKFETLDSGVNITGNLRVNNAPFTSGITVQEEGSSLSTAGTTLNFVGSNVTATGSGATKTITITGGSGVSGFINNVKANAFTGDASTTAFTLSDAPADSDDVLVFINGVLQHTNTYSISGTTLTLDSAPDSASEIETRTHLLQSANLVLRDHKSYVYTLDTTTDSVSGADSAGVTLAYDVGKVDVFANGSRLVTGKDFTATNGTSIVFDSAFSSGNVIEVVSHAKATTADLNGILSIDSDLTTTGANQIIHTYAAANHRTLKFTAQIEHDSSSSYHAEEVLLTHNDSDVAMTTYAQVLLDSNLGTFDADINSGNVRIKFSPTKTNTSIKLRAIRTPA